MSITRQLLPDGGTALFEKVAQLPRRIVLTERTVMCQPLEEIEAGRCLICQDFFGHFFSFNVPMTADQLRAHFEREGLLVLENFRPGPERRSVLSFERVRDVYCDVAKRKPGADAPDRDDPNDTGAYG